MPNYSNMYKTNEAEETVDEVLNPTVEEDFIPEVDTTPEAETEPEAVTGVVVNCAKLNVREQMSTNSKVLCVLPASTEVVVFMDEEYDDWYYVCTEDQTLGYCMKKYISINS